MTSGHSVPHLDFRTLSLSVRRLRVFLERRVRFPPFINEEAVPRAAFLRWASAWAAAAPALYHPEAPGGFAGTCFADSIAAEYSAGVCHPPAGAVGAPYVGDGF